MKRTLISLFLSTALLAQQQDDMPVFRTSSNLVVVTVFVRDKSGRPLKGLKKEDFVITENGKAQTIGVFDFQELSSEKVERAAAMATEVKEAPVAAPAAAATPTGRERFRDKRLMVLFFDWSSLEPADQIRAREAAEKYLKEQMTTSDYVSVVTFSSRLKVEQEFTSDRQALLDLLKKFATGQGSDLAQAGATDVDNSDDTAGYTADDTEFNVFNTDRKLAALEEMARKLSALPEKKALIYFSAGVSRTGDDNEAQLRATINAAVRANVSFYPVDVRGMTADAPGGSAAGSAGRGGGGGGMGGRGGGSGIYTGSTQSSQRASFVASQDTLTALASDTGGKALLDNNQLEMGITQAQEDLQSYYILGYYSGDEKKDGAFRKVDVKLTQASQTKYQAKLDYRRGYFAAKEWKAFGSFDKEKQLEDALLMGDPVTDLPIALEVNWFRVTKDRYFTPVAVKIPGSEIPLKKQGSAETTTFDFIGQIRDARGGLQGSVRDSIKIQLRDEKAGKLASHSLVYDTGFTLDPGRYTIKLLVRENQTGKMGTFETKFTVPNLNEVKDTVRLSSVVFSTQKTAVAEAVGLADKKLKKQEAHPLVRDNQKLLPSVTHAFRNGQNVYVYAELYEPVIPEGAARPAAQAGVSLYKGRKLVYESVAMPVVTTKAGHPTTAPIYLELPLRELEPGEYTAQLNVIDQAGQKFAFARAPMVILKNTAPVEAK